MQRISLDEKSARRIASGRIRSNFPEMLHRALVVKTYFPNNGGSQAVRQAYSLERNFFGDGWIWGKIEGRLVLAIGITAEDLKSAGGERYILLGVSNNTRSNNVRRGVLIVFSEHAVARAMQRTGQVSPERALAAACSGIDMVEVSAALIGGSNETSISFATKTGALHCVVDSGLMICKTFIDAPGQGGGALAGGC